MVRTRIAPSPTGKLHIGTARAALFNYLFTRKQKGVFVLRIEDTDKQRSRKEFEEDIIDGLSWLSLSWDEFYRQSERSSLYRSHLEALLAGGKAFYCFCPSEETGGGVHFCPGRDDVGTKSNRGGGIIRFKTAKDREVAFEDAIRGRVVFNTNEVGDFSLAKSLEEPLFNFTLAVDDFDMGITHVIRGEDHISNVPKHILVQEALGFSTPIYAHLPLILGPDRSKLSKRHGAAALSDYRAQGYLPEALINFMAFLGWNPGDEREFFTLEELIGEFSLSRVKKGGSIFNIDRLNFTNRHYMKALSPDALLREVFPFFEKRYGAAVLKDVGKKNLTSMVLLERERANTLAEFPEKLDFFFALPSYEKNLLLWKSLDNSAIRTNLQNLEGIIEEIPLSRYNKEELERTLLAEVEKRTGDRGEYLWPLRVALSGKQHSPSPFDIASLLGKEETLRRIFHAISLLT